MYTRHLFSYGGLPQVLGKVWSSLGWKGGSAAVFKGDNWVLSTQLIKPNYPTHPLCLYGKGAFSWSL